MRAYGGCAHGETLFVSGCTRRSPALSHREEDGTGDRQREGSGYSGTEEETEIGGGDLVSESEFAFDAVGLQ